MLVNKRIKEVRKMMGLTQSKMAERIAISTSYLGEIETCVKIANERVIRLLGAEFNISEHWLRTGEGSTFNEDTNPHEARAASIFKSLSLPLQICAVNILEELAQLDQQCIKDTQKQE